MLKNRRLHLTTYQKILENRRFNLVFALTNKKTGELILYRPTIKSMWHKDFCYAYGRERTEKLKNKFKATSCRMITLTYDTNLYSAKQVADRHKADLKKFVRLMRKAFERFEYAYFVEITKKNYVHFHIYTDAFYPYEKVKQIWHQCTGSYIIEIHQIKTEKQILYTSNYHQIQSKYNFEQLLFAWKNINRFFGQSRNFFKKEEDSESLFTFLGFVKFKGYEVFRELKKLEKNGGILITQEELSDFLSSLNLYLIINKNEDFVSCVSAIDFNKMMVNKITTPKPEWDAGILFF